MPGSPAPHALLLRRGLRPALFVVVPTLLTALALVLVSASARRALDDDLERHLDAVVTVVRPGILPACQDAALNVLGRAVAIPFEVRDHHGNLVFRSPGFPNLNEPAEHAATEAIVHRLRLTTLAALEPPFRLATAFVPAGSAEPVAVQVAVPMASSFVTFWPSAVWLLGGEALLLAGLVWLARPRRTAAHSAIVSRLDAISGGARPERLEAPPDDAEIARMVSAMNGVLDRMARSQAATETFATMAAREIQGPLAAITATAETWALSKASAMSRQAEEVAEEAKRASALLRDLRLLALADAGRLVTRPEPLDLKAVVTECADIARAVAEAKGVRVQTRLDARPVVEGSVNDIRRLVLNLAQRAIRASEPFGPVEIRLQTNGAEASVIVWDAQDLPPADVPRLFDRCFQPSPDRPRDCLEDGLELAVAQAIAVAHGGRVTVETQPARGTTFTAFLPLSVRL